MKYDHKMIDPYKNIAYGSTANEEFTLFAFEENKRYPIQVEMIGVTNPDKDYFIARKTPHYFVIEYVESGEGFLEVGGEKYNLSAGDVYILTPGIPHKYGADKKNPYRKIWINCFSGFLNEFLAIYGLADKVVFKNSGCKKYFDEMLKYALDNPYNEENSVGISRILFSLFFDLCEKFNTFNGVSVVAQKAKQLLDGAIYRKVNIEKLAEEVNVSKSQLSREFKKYYNCSPYQYLMNKKITVAKQLILNTKMKVSEISDALCFSDEYNFSNTFKAKTGVSPLAFKKLEGKLSDN